MTAEVKKSNCHFCGYLCALNATVEDGCVTHIEPDPTRYPYNPDILAGCRRWKMNMQVLDGADRINYPLKRVGERGGGAWRRVSWDEALADIAERLAELRDTYHSGVLASMIGGPHTSFWPLHRFMSYFGSPNNVGIGQICWNPRIWMDSLTFGWTIEAHITSETNTLVIWGTNPAESDNSLFWRTILKMSHDEKPKIIVVDPRFTKTARIADTWIAPKPGTDTVLALALINVIIAEELYDADFVEAYCHGFQELKEHVQSYTPTYAERICDVPQESIVELAHALAQAPSAFVTGRGIDQIGKNVAPFHRARCILLAITGNIDRPGANFLNVPSDFVEELDLEGTLDNFEVLKKLSLNTGRTPLQSYEGYAAVTKAMSAHGVRLPARYLTSAHPDLVLQAMESGDPYPIRALIVEATNPLLTYADTHRVYHALKALDLLVVIDYYMTPTAALADYVLPSAGALERPTFQAHGGVANNAYGGAAACAPYYERKVDYEIFRELGLRLGQQAVWPQETFEEACAATLAPCGMDWDTYCELGMYSQFPGFYKYAEADEDGSHKGFATKTGKIELASELLDELGQERLPHPKENRALCSPSFIAERSQQGWKHVELITGGRKQPYNASMYFNNAEFRTTSPYPYAEMSEKTARELGVCAGDTIALATDQGEALFRVAIIAMRDGLIHADYGWWHPEWDMTAETLGGMWESNINMLTSCSLDQSEESIGTWSYNAIDCMAKRSDAALTWNATSASEAS